MAGLVKPGISLAVTLSALLGYLVHTPKADPAFFQTALFTFLLCAGSGTLNNCQDRFPDQALSRTRSRPLPRGDIAPFLALIIALALILAGLAGLGLFSGAHSAVWGGWGILLYNGIYTPLKVRTPLAIIPGALCGMVPPALGWSAAGGHFPPPVMVIWVMVVLGIWQLPHFWLVLMGHETDYRRQAQSPMLRLFSGSQMHRILLVWVSLLSVIITLAPLFYPQGSPAALRFLALVGMIAAGWFLTRFMMKQPIHPVLDFQALNLVMGVFIGILMVDLLMQAAP